MFRQDRPGDNYASMFLLDVAIFMKNEILIRIVRVRKALRMKILGAFFFCTYKLDRTENYFTKRIQCLQGLYIKKESRRLIFGQNEFGRKAYKNIGREKGGRRQVRKS